MNTQALKLIFLLLLFSVACTAQIRNNIAFKNSCQPTELSFKGDTSHFTHSFLSSLKKLVSGGNWGKVTIYNHYIINGTDTISFPDELKIERLYYFKNNKTSKTYKLNIKRINEVLIEYEAGILSGATTIFSQKGFAELNPSFFLGPEVNEDDETGLAYPASEYIDNLSKNEFTIKISNNIDSSNQLKATWEMKGKAKESPTLRLAY